MSEPSAFPAVTLKRGKARPVWAGHPWIYSGAIETMPRGLVPGSLVSVLDDSGVFIGLGTATPGARITVRMLAKALPETGIRGLIEARVHTAIARRKLWGLPRPDTSAYRLLNGEGDGLPGVIADVLGTLISVQITTAAAERWLPDLLDVFEAVLSPTGIVVDVPEDSARLESIAPGDRIGRGQLETHVPFLENGIEWRLLPGKGQKTGFYSDQRDNRARLAQLAKGATVLDCFCYTGGFGLNALKAGAVEVIGVDSSGPAVSVAHGTALQNGLEGGTWHKEDAMRFMKGLEGRQFDIVVLDPPKLAKSRESLNDAFRKYLSLNALGLRHVKPGGTLVSCTCSGLVDEEMFMRMLTDAALEAGRRVFTQAIHGPGADHVVPTACPESRYLTVVFATVE